MIISYIDACVELLKCQCSPQPTNRRVSRPNTKFQKRLAAIIACVWCEEAANGTARIFETLVRLLGLVTRNPKVCGVFWEFLTSDAR